MIILPYSLTHSTKVHLDQFSLILKFLHLNDNSGYIPRGQPGHGPLYKLRTLLTPLLVAAFTLH